MNVYTYSEARQKLASLLEQAIRDGQVIIKRRDGQRFVIRPERQPGSPLDVESLDLGLTATEIVQFVQEGRRPGYDAAAEVESAASAQETDR